MLARTVGQAGVFGFNPSKWPEFSIIVTVSGSPRLFAAVAYDFIASIHWAGSLPPISSSCLVPIGNSPAAEA